MSSQPNPTHSEAPSSVPRPRIPEDFLDVPSQRLYLLSLGALLQAIKVFDFLQYLISKDNEGSFGRKWFIVDFLYCICLAVLRIPRLRYSKSMVTLQIVSLWILDGLMFGGIVLNVGGHSWIGIPSVGFSNHAEITSTPRASSLWDLIPTLGLGVLLGASRKNDVHLLGQHTVRMSPISTAQMNPYGETFCLAEPGHSVLIPILLNNTNPSSVRYSLIPLGFVEGSSEKEKPKTGSSNVGLGKIEYFEVSAKELKAIENARSEGLQVARTAASQHSSDDYDEYDDEDEAEDISTSHKSPSLQKTQGLVHIRLNKPGTLHLERVLDASNIEARLVYPNSVTVVPCPRAEFTDNGIAVPGEDIRCAPPGLASGAGEELNLQIHIFGVPPLSLRWSKEIDGNRESFMVEGIESSGHAHPHSAEEGRKLASARGFRVPVDLKIPLTVSLNALGTHSYVLESVVDAIGNVVQAGLAVASDPLSVHAPHNIDATHDRIGSLENNKSTSSRSVTVLRRPSVLFQNCGPGNPMSLLIGSEAPLAILAKDADLRDAPWEVSVEYQPPWAEEGNKISGKRYKPWTKTIQTHKDKKELIVHASAPGEYTILGVKGKHCEGDILSPDTCKVVERPLPTAEIEWKKIHECSGDIGVSASLVLHGTPPFQVYYRIQRDNEPPRELSKTFATSRGEITIQPERSGRYVFKFVQISDANYQKVDLKSPSIDQVVHPPAFAEFSNSIPGGGGKKKINSCSGSMVDVDVDLRGTGPWNLKVQVVGPKGSDIVQIPGITSPRRMLRLPIPKAVDKEGGSFEIDLVSVEDAYGCKRALSVPGIMVNVRRVQPTARFYGQGDRRNITVLDHEHAKLPLRLTGDGPWHLKYRRAEIPAQVHTATLASPNDDLRVTQKGLYEILEVADSQCPGSVIATDATYQVNHIPRPSARLTSEIQAIYEPYNGSHILQPICEGVNDHVDLELTGRPPFQIMYNIARDNEMGGTKILDQPTFSSIQPRTSFQLHTNEAARIYYEVKQIGDAAYPLVKNKNAVIPRSERLLFEQQVLMRPTARFKNHNRISYCLNDALVPHDAAGPDGLITLEGTPPFHLQLSVRNLATSETYTEMVELHDSSWKLHIPSYTFRSVGPHLVTIESVRDASNCEQTVPDTLHRSIWVDVAETAAIVPFDRREDFCVGDAIQFQLEGTPPWAIGYRVNGKSLIQDAKISPFSIVQQQSGEFAITSIAHQQKLCKTAVTDLRYTVHPLPSARVGHGKRIVQDIHEGDQAEIIFTLIGEPPFTFTYQRTELSPKKGAQGKVLETHTVSGVTTKEYSIFSALEGTWTITSISDRYCRYPPAQPDGLTEKSRH
ncbi:hypothetical protein AcW1_001243 [Taiwanofungus camphoratus]|nr:hypothetical protein AcW1_001243 [Antrodia cinnamomea]